MAVGTNIKRKREDAGLTLRELARKCRVSYPFISQVENGKNITIFTLAKIARGLKCNVSELMK